MPAANRPPAESTPSAVATPAMTNRSTASLAIRLLQGALLLLPLFLFASCATPQSDPTRPSSHHASLPEWLAPKMDPDDRIFYHDALLGRNL